MAGSADIAEAPAADTAPAPLERDGFLDEPTALNLELRAFAVSRGAKPTDLVNWPDAATCEEIAWVRHKRRQRGLTHDLIVVTVALQGYEGPDGIDTAVYGLRLCDPRISVEELGKAIDAAIANVRAEKIRQE